MAENRNRGGAAATADKPPTATPDADKPAENQADATPPADQTETPTKESADDEQSPNGEAEDSGEETEDDEDSDDENRPAGGMVEGVTLIHGPEQQSDDVQTVEAEKKEPITPITLGMLTDQAEKAIHEMEDDSSIVPGDKTNLTELKVELDELIEQFGADYRIDQAKKFVQRVTGAALDMIARFYQHVYQTRLGRMAEMVSKEWNKTDEMGRLEHPATAKIVLELLHAAEFSRLKGVPDGRLIIATTSGGVIVTWVPDGLHSKRADFSTSRRGVEGATRGRRPAGEGPIEWTENGAVERLSGSDALIRLYAKGSRTAKHCLEQVEGWAPTDIQAAVRGEKSLGSNPPKTKTNRLLYAKNALRDEQHPYARVVDEEQKAAA